MARGGDPFAGWGGREGKVIRKSQRDKGAGVPKAVAPGICMK